MDLNGWPRSYLEFPNHLIVVFLMILMFEMILAGRSGICLSQLYFHLKVQHCNAFHVLRGGEGWKSILPQSTTIERQWISIYQFILMFTEGCQGLISIFVVVLSHMILKLRSCSTLSALWFGTFLFFHILVIIIPTDSYFSEWLVYHQPAYFWGQNLPFVSMANAVGAALTQTDLKIFPSASHSQTPRIDLEHHVKYVGGKNP